MNKKNLILISCSKIKKKNKELMPAISRYDGVNFKVLKKHFPSAIPDNLDILIISAKYGLLKSEDAIEYYEQKMDIEIAKGLCEEVLEGLKEIFMNNTYNEVFINMGKEYRLIIDGFDKFVPNATKIIFAEGSIGKKLSCMKKWLSKNYEKLSKNAL